MIAFLAIFSPFMQEQKEMMYLAYFPVILSGEKIEKVLGYIPLSDGWNSLKETMIWIDEKTSVRHTTSTKRNLDF